jgi:hypothetical protein
MKKCESDQTEAGRIEVKQLILLKLLILLKPVVLFKSLMMFSC